MRTGVLTSLDRTIGPSRGIHGDLTGRGGLMGKIDALAVPYDPKPCRRACDGTSLRTAWPSHLADLGHQGAPVDPPGLPLLVGGGRGGDDGRGRSGAAITAPLLAVHRTEGAVAAVAGDRRG